MKSYEERLRQLGLELPDVPKPIAAFVPARKVGNLIFCAGQGPFKDGKYVCVGKVGAERTLEEGREAARLSALNALAAVRSILGTLDKVDCIVHVRGFVNCAPDFGQQPEVIDGASELLEEIFGENGKHARAALGTSALPRGISVELEMIVKEKD